ncbi:MAG: hypothetical protein SFZ23_08945 [Planctomycetota bacterium]|nr:hypothetical protein [Planctomycetota bacterium]
MEFIIGTLVFVLVIAALVAAVVYIVVPVFKGLGWLVAHIARFIYGMFSDLFRFIGAVLTLVVFVPLVLVNLVIGRWSAASHFGRSIQSELGIAGACLYRVGIGHPLRLLGMRHVVAGIEERLPQAIAAAPGPDHPSPRRVNQFEGYTIVGSLPGGGSGGKLYVATPSPEKLEIFRRRAQVGVQQVVIKAFSQHDGSTLPQIVREGRALDAAKKLGLVLDHELNNDRFFYVTRYVPGQRLGEIATQLHAAGPATGLNDQSLRAVMGYVADLLRTLEVYHRGGLWHKDVKPDNIVVDSQGAHLVDLGLVTPLRSAMTLTTHGTEYFRDPEMVRMALRGAKVDEVDGTKFDIYAAGAVLYAMIENSFPAHGVLSRVSKRCPDAVRWIIQRAMTDYEKRYASASQMLADVEAVRLSTDPMIVRPVDLPSFRGGLDSGPASGEAAESDLLAAAAPVVTGLPTPPPLPFTGASQDQAAGNVFRPEGGGLINPFAAAGAPVAVAGAGVAGAAGPAGAGGMNPDARRGPDGRTAEQILHAARERLDATRARAHAKIAKARSRRERRGRGEDRGFASAPRGATRGYRNGPNVGVWVAIGIATFFGVIAAVERFDRSSQSDSGEELAIPSVDEMFDGIALNLDVVAPAAPEAPEAPEASESPDALDGFAPIAGVATTAAARAESEAARAEIERALNEVTRDLGLDAQKPGDWSWSEMGALVREMDARAQANASGLTREGLAAGLDRAGLNEESAELRRQIDEIMSQCDRVDAAGPGPVVLTVVDLPVGQASALRSQREQIARRLAALGFVVRGDLRLAPLPAVPEQGQQGQAQQGHERHGQHGLDRARLAPTSEDVEIVASAQLFRGSTPADASNFSAKLEEWLRASVGEVDAIVWVSPSRRADAPQDALTITVVGPIDRAGELRSQEFGLVVASALRR